MVSSTSAARCAVAEKLRKGAALRPARHAERLSDPRNIVTLRSDDGREIGRKVEVCALQLGCLSPNPE